MSRTGAGGIPTPALVLLSLAFLAPPLHAQSDRSKSRATTAEQAMDQARRTYGPPAPQSDCKPQEGDEIVVCAGIEDQPEFRVKSTSQLDPESKEALHDGLPRAPDFGESCKKNPEKGPCIGFGSVPPPAIFIDIEALPKAPEGSDADRISKGLPPLEND